MNARFLRWITAAWILVILTVCTIIPAFAVSSTSSESSSVSSVEISPQVSLTPEELDALRFPDEAEARRTMVITSVTVVAVVTAVAVPLYRRRR